MATESGEEVYVREYLGLVDWADQPLPLSDYNEAQAWDIGPDGWDFMLSPDHTPDVLLPIQKR